MKVRDWFLSRQKRKAHQRYLQERARQDALRGRDPQESVRAAASGSAGAQQGMYGQS
jgi:hypothetical protein